MLRFRVSLCSAIFIIIQNNRQYFAIYTHKIRIKYANIAFYKPIYIKINIPSSARTSFLLFNEKSAQYNHY